MEALDYVKLYAQAAVDPILSDDDINNLLLDCRIVDSENRLITDANYVSTYDLNLAVSTAWELKSAKVSGNYAFADNGLNIHREQIIENCLRLAKL